MANLKVSLLEREKQSWIISLQMYTINKSKPIHISNCIHFSIFKSGYYYENHSAYNFNKTTCFEHL